MRFRIFILLLFIISVGYASEYEVDLGFRINPEDSFLGFDKVKHFSTSMYFEVSGYYLQNRCFDIDNQNSLNNSVGFTFSLGLGKEFYDLYWKKSKFSWKDIVANFAGIGMGILVVNGVK